MEGASNSSENSFRPENTPTSAQPRNRPSNSAAGSSSRHSETNRLLDKLAKDLEYRDGDGQRSRENSLTPSARRGATSTPPAQSASKYCEHTHCHYHYICICVPFSKYARRSSRYNMLTVCSISLSWKYPGGREATGNFLLSVAHREMDRRRDAQPNPTWISEERFPIEAFLGWRIYDKDSVVIHVRWADGSPDTEEPEEIMHIDSAQTLLNFWRRQGGRGWATRQAGLRENRILRVLKSRESRKDNGSELLLCQWIGLPASDRYTTWMSEEEVQDRALGQWLEFKTGVNNIFG